MALTPDNFKQILMKATMAYFDQLQKDLEVRIALVLKLSDSGLSETVMIAISQETSREISEFLRMQVIVSGELEKVVDKLL